MGFRKHKTILLTLFFAFSLSALAHTEKESIIKTPNLYVVGGVGLGKVTDEIFSSTVEYDASIVALLGLGYQFNRFIALEFDYLYFSNSTYEKRSLFGSHYEQDINVNTIALLGVLKYPFYDDKLAVFGKLGPSYSFREYEKRFTTHTSTGRSEQFDIATGAGVEVNFNERASGQLQYMRTGIVAGGGVLGTQPAWATLLGVVVRF